MTTGGEGDGSTTRPTTTTAHNSDACMHACGGALSKRAALSVKRRSPCAERRPSRPAAAARRRYVSGEPLTRRVNVDAFTASALGEPPGVRGHLPRPLWEVGGWGGAGGGERMHGTAASKSAGSSAWLWLTHASIASAGAGCSHKSSQKLDLTGLGAGCSHSSRALCNSLSTYW